MNGRAPAILDHLSSLADATRSRILLLVDRHELTVSELCGVMQLPQSTVSRHLKALSEGGWIASRAEGTSNLYARCDDLDASAGVSGRWSRAGRPHAGNHAGSTPMLSVLAERKTSRRSSFRPLAGGSARDDLFRSAFILRRSAFADGGWIVGDLGCGTGQMTAALAPFVKHVIAVDGSAAMLQAAKKRLHGLENVELRRGELEALPIDDGRLDAATIALVLHHLPEPGLALSEVARVLKPGGRSDRRQAAARSRATKQMGHVWLGFRNRSSACSRTGFQIRIVRSAGSDRKVQDCLSLPPRVTQTTFTNAPSLRCRKCAAGPERRSK
jgi:ArsR family transcriptional regulator